MSKYEETINDSVRVCPYGESEYQPESEDYSEDERTEECQVCGKKYYAHDIFSVAHSARPDCVLNGEDHEWETKQRHPDYQFCNKCGKCRRTCKGEENQ